VVQVEIDDERQVVGGVAGESGIRSEVNGSKLA
jgi:hypothetical protein